MTSAPIDDVSIACQRYREDGWLPLATPVDQSVVSYVRDSIDRWVSVPPEGSAFEPDGRTLRAVHGCHLVDDVYARLTRLPTFLNLAREILQDDVYVYQFKVNIKQAFEGKAWPWHTDFSFWVNEDGMKSPDALNVAVNIDDVHTENGPIVLLSGSHNAEIGSALAPRSAAPGSNWRDSVSAELPYTVDESVVWQLSRHYPQTRLTGPAGSAFAFHPSIVHSSSNNLSAERRSLLIITYNAISNVPARLARPEFLVGRDAAPLQPLAGPVV